MIYFATANSPGIRDAMTAGLLGCIITPGGGIRHDSSWLIADNACFGDAYPGDDAWFAWLSRQAEEHHGRIVFATAPDVVGDAAATLERSLPWLGRIRDLGIPAAFVLQDGITVDTVPWDECDAVFIGGTTHFKYSHEVELIATEAKRRGKWVHMGRVNSEKRIRYAFQIGCDSVDGTYLVFGPEKNLPRLLRFMQNGTVPTLW